MPPGFETERVLLATPRIQTPPHTASTAQDFYRRLSDGVRGVPGVRSVSFASAPPLGDGEAGVEGLRVRPREPGGRDVTAAQNLVSAGYFATLGIPIVRGRGLSDDDTASEPRPVVISDALARMLFPGGEPIGQELAAGRERLLTVVGVAGDVSSLAGDGGGRLTVYEPRSAQVAGDAMMVRFDGDAGATAGAVRDVLRTLDPNTVVEPRTIGVLRRELADRLLRIVKIVVVLGVAAVALAAIGLYGIASFSADRRSREMGIRIALGATRADIVGAALRSGLKPVAFGLCLGTAIAALAARALQLSLERVNIEAQSPATYVAAVSLLGSIALMAMLGPALRAGRSDPLVVLRRDRD
jgi:ABC-type antimicrobial peptide transport system permease subunit